MRKLIQWAVLGTLMGAAIFYLAARTARPTATTEEGLSLTEEDVPDEPHPVDALLPDPARLTADWKPFEPVDLLRSQETPLVQPDDAGKDLPRALVAKNSLAEEVVPGNVIRSNDEAECFRLMPYCETAESLPLMPYADQEMESLLSFPRSGLDSSNAVNSAGFSGHDAGNRQHQEEEEQGEPVADPKIIQERLNRILQLYLKKGRHPAGAGIDTMEFRPSDAKKGDFDRIPF